MDIKSQEDSCQQPEQMATLSIKAIVFNVDDVFWQGNLDAKSYGKGPGALYPLQDNLELITDNTIRDKSNHQNSIILHDEVPEIICDINRRGIKIGILSDESDKALCDRALWYFQSFDSNNHLKPIISFMTWDEVGTGDKISSLNQICDWSHAAREETVFFDSDPNSKDACTQLGVRFEHVDKVRGLDWTVYRRALTSHANIPDTEQPYDIPNYRQPSLGRRLGKGKFGVVYESPCDSQVVIKVMNVWTSAMKHRYLEIYDDIKRGQPVILSSSQHDKYLSMIAYEIRNLCALEQLISPKPENFSGWLKMPKAEGMPLWCTELYRKHPFSVPFQTLLRCAFHLVVNEIENTVQKYGIEHRDAHLANVRFIMEGSMPIKAKLFDWGIAVRMEWDGHEYVRGSDTTFWEDGVSEAGERYTKEKLRKYWISWMVRTEYEALANPERGLVEANDVLELMKDLSWWFQQCPRENMPN